MALLVIQNTIGYVNPSVSILDTGWVINGPFASHSSCNAGVMTALNSFGLVIGRSYVFQYTVDQFVSGSVKLIAGTTNGTSRTANGVYTETLTVAGNNFLSFFSDGNLRISQLSFYDSVTGMVQGTTISFNEKENSWGAEYSARPENIIKFVDKLFMFKNGGLWRSHVNPVNGNFFGVQYSFKVVYIVNQDYEKNKLWYNLRLDSTGQWYIANITVPPNDQFPNGMQTLMTRANLKSIDGKLWADILRDITDPNFAYISDPDQRNAMALFQGRLIQGGYLIITLQNDDPGAASLSSAETYYIEVQKSL